MDKFDADENMIDIEKKINLADPPRTPIIQHWHKSAQARGWMSKCPFCLFQGISYLHLSKHITLAHKSQVDTLPAGSCRNVKRKYNENISPQDDVTFHEKKDNTEITAILNCNKAELNNFKDDVCAVTTSMNHNVDAKNSKDDISLTEVKADIASSDKSLKRKRKDEEGTNLEDKITSIQKIYICSNCSAECSSRSGLKHHRRRKHCSNIKTVKNILNDLIGDVIVIKYGELMELETDKIASIQNLYICSICNAKCPTKNALKNHTKNKKHKANIIIVKHILDDIFEDATVTEYGELLNLKKWECSEDTEIVMAVTSHKSHTEELENFQDDVVSAVMTSMNQYFDARKSSRNGTFL